MCQRLLRQGRHNFLAQDSCPSDTFRQLHSHNILLHNLLTGVNREQAMYREQANNKCRRRPTRLEATMAMATAMIMAVWRIYDRGLACR